MLDVENINTYYWSSHILRDVSLKVPHGSIVAMLGRNGMGKTTIIRSIMGLTPPRDGVIRFKDEKINGLAAVSDLAQGHLARASGAHRLPLPDRQGEPPDRRARDQERRLVEPRQGLRPVPDPRRSGRASTPTC